MIFLAICFFKTKNLTNRFDRLEVRILAKMMVLRAILETKDAKKEKSAAPVEKPVVTELKKG